MIKQIRRNGSLGDVERIECDIKKQDWWKNGVQEHGHRGMTN